MTDEEDEDECPSQVRPFFSQNTRTRDARVGIGHGPGCWIRLPHGAPGRPLEDSRPVQSCTPLHQGGDCGWRAEVADARACTLTAGPASLTLARGASTLTCRHTGLRLQKDAGPASRVVRRPVPAYRRQRLGGNPPPLPPPPLSVSRNRPSPGQKPGCGSGSGRDPHAAPWGWRVDLKASYSNPGAQAPPQAHPYHQA